MSKINVKNNLQFAERRLKNKEIRDGWGKKTFLSSSPAENKSGAIKRKK